MQLIEPNRRKLKKPLAFDNERDSSLFVDIGTLQLQISKIS